MVRPSQNLQQTLLDSGMALLPTHGCKGLAVRKVTEHAQVNLGMFHYHFKSKDIFIRAVLQGMYEEMFEQLSLGRQKSSSAIANLQDALFVLAKFTIKNEALLSRLVSDAIAGERIAIEFLETSFPRHTRLIADLILLGQTRREIIMAPLPNLVVFIAGAVNAPIILGGAASRRQDTAHSLVQQVLSEAATSQRIALAIKAISLEPSKDNEFNHR